MNADEDKLVMNSKDQTAGRVGNLIEYPLKEETHAIIGCSFEVLNGLGHGLNEKCYENSLVVEFMLRKISYEQQRGFQVVYKDHPVGLFVPDLIAHGQIIVDTKVIDKITDHERGQMLNYLRITKLTLGLILNFKYLKLEWERVVLSNPSQRVGI
jgi:GxxExxY protein